MSYVLVVEDDEAISELMEEILTEEGYEVQCAGSGAEALSMACERQPDLIVTDIRLGHESGASFIETYRQLPDGHAHLVVVSGVTNLRDEAAKLGADDCLSKPFELDDLLGAVARAIQRKCWRSDRQPEPPHAANRRLDSVDRRWSHGALPVQVVWRSRRGGWPIRDLRQLRPRPATAPRPPRQRWGRRYTVTAHPRAGCEREATAGRVVALHGLTGSPGNNATEI
jgi:CheY-like chemotaxis protein